MKIRYLLDENLDPRFVRTLNRYYPMVDVVRVGDAGAPALGTKDPELLAFVEEHRRILVTDNRKSMPQHLLEHLTNGRHHWGIFMIDKSVSYRRLTDALYVYWDVSSPDEWVDRVEWVIT